MRLIDGRSESEKQTLFACHPSFAVRTRDFIAPPPPTSGRYPAHRFAYWVSSISRFLIARFETGLNFTGRPLIAPIGDGDRKQREIRPNVV